MKLKQIWVISQSGLQLFAYSPKYCPYCTGILALENMKENEYRCQTCFRKVTQIDTNNTVDTLLKASGVYNILTYFSNFLIQEPTELMLTNKWMWVAHTQTIHHFDPPEQIVYIVLAVVEIDLSIPIKNQESVVRGLCRSVALEFYDSCKDLIVQANGANIQMYDIFRPLCTQLVVQFTRTTLVNEIQ